MIAEPSRRTCQSDLIRVPLSVVLREKFATQRHKWRFRRDQIKRVWKYRGTRFSTRIPWSSVAQLKTDGYAILRQAVDPSRLLTLKAEMEAKLDSGKSLNPVSKDSARAPGDLRGSKLFLTAEEIACGQQYLSQHTNYVSIREPLLECPSSVPIAFQDLLIDIAAGYLRCWPAIGGVNLRKSFANDLPEFDTLYFHCDNNSPTFLKFFFYLNDVDENGGPFCYVRASHNRKFPGWKSKYRWTEEEIAAQYGEQNILKLTGRVGDLVVADTTGFHRGTKVVSHDRTMYTVDYVVHREFGGTAAPFKLASKDYDNLSSKQTAAADFLEPI